MIIIRFLAILAVKWIVEPGSYFLAIDAIDFFIHIDRPGKIAITDFALFSLHH